MPQNEEFDDLRDKYDSFCSDCPEANFFLHRQAGDYDYREKVGKENYYVKIFCSFMHKTFEPRDVAQCDHLFDIQREAIMLKEADEKKPNLENYLKNN